MSSCCTQDMCAQRDDRLEQYRDRCGVGRRGEVWRRMAMRELPELHPGLSFVWQVRQLSARMLPIPVAMRTCAALLNRTGMDQTGTLPANAWLLVGAGTP